MSLFDHPAPAMPLARELFAALGRRAWREVAGMSAPGVVLEVHAAPGIRVRRNQHLWREVSLQGRGALADYLAALNEAVPSLTLEARAAARPVEADQEVVRATCAGVDNAGSPFDAETDFVLWGQDGVLQGVRARVNEVAVGGDVLGSTEGDPRRFFRAFLEA